MKTDLIKKTPIVIRAILALPLLWFAYKETGPATVTILVLVMASVEIQIIISNLHTESIKNLSKLF